MVHTNHKPLASLCTQRSLSPMLANWLDLILGYDFDTEYVHGATNAVADLFSRAFESWRDVKAEMTACAAMSTEELAFLMQERGKRVPSVEERAEIITKAHVSGHSSVEIMYRKIYSDGIWWPSLRDDLRTAVQHCAICQRYKALCLANHEYTTWSMDFLNQDNNKVIDLRTKNS